MIELPDTARPPGPERLDPTPGESFSFGEQVGNAWTAETIRTDAWHYADRTRRDIVADLQNRLPDPVRQDIAATVQRARNLSPARRQDLEQRLLFDSIARLGRDPLTAPRFDGLPTTAEALEAEVNRRRRAELDEAEAALALDPNFVASFLGAGARAMTDPVSLALLPFGGSIGVGRAAVLKFIGREAALGAAGEAGVLPREFEVADELGLPDPNVAERLAFGAAGGAAVGGLFVAGQRVAQYALGREARGKPDDLTQHEHEADVTNAEADLLTGNSPADQPVAAAAPSGVDGIVGRIIQIESSGNPSAQNPNSSAGGLGQFIDSTWLDMIRRHRPDLTEGRSQDEVLALKFDPVLNREMTRIFTEENIAYLQSRGLPTEPGDVYLAHFLGKGGAANVLRQAADVPIRAIMPPSVIQANAAVRWGNKPFADFTVADLRAWASGRMNNSRPSGAGAGGSFEGYTSRGYTSSGQVAAGDMTVDVTYEVVDASDLSFASGDMQPRDRSRGTSDAQIADMAARLDPARLMPAPEADRGAPIVGPDGMIESGNGRVRAIQRAREVAPDRLAAYRQQIELAGYDIPEGIETPVLIARRTSAMTDEQRVAFAYRANSPDVARMSATEMAQAHSRLIDGALLAQVDPSRPLANQANRDFARAFLNRLPQSERGAYTTAQGGLSYDGERMLEAALFARAFDATDLLAQFAERGDPALKSFIAALQEASPAWAALRAEIAAGNVDASLDISAFVNEALMLIGEARRIAAQTDRLGIGQAIEDLLAQDDMFDALSPLTAALVRKFFAGGRTASADQIAAFLKDYAAEAMRIGTGDLLGDLPGPLDVLRTLDNATFGKVDDIGRPKGRMEAPAPASMAAPVPDLFATVADNAELEARNRAALNAQTIKPTEANRSAVPEASAAQNAASALNEIKGGRRAAYVAPEIETFVQDYHDAVRGYRDLPSGAPISAVRAADQVRTQAQQRLIEAFDLPTAEQFIAMQAAGHPDFEKWLSVRPGEIANVFDQRNGTVAEAMELVDALPALPHPKNVATDRAFPPRTTSETALTPANADAIADARAALNDLGADLPDDTRDLLLRDMRDTLDDIEADDQMVAVLDACTLGTRGRA